MKPAVPVHTILGEAFENNDRTAPQQGIAPDLNAQRHGRLPYSLFPTR